MNLRASRHTPALLAILGFCACHGIGRPLVDKKDGEGSRNALALCVLAPECKEYSSYDLQSVVPTADHELVDTGACGATAAACEPFIDELGVATYAGCSAAWPTSKIESAVDGNVFNCTSVRITRVGEDTAPVSTQSVELRRTNVFISSESPLQVTLEDALIDDVTFVLGGPVTLRVSNARALRHVRVLGDDAAGGEQRVEISQVDGEDLSIGGGQDRFLGTVTLENGALTDVRINATSIDTANISISRLRFESDSLVAANSNLALALISFIDGRWMGTLVTEADVLQCGSLAIITGEISRAHLPACDTPLRVYGAALEHSFVDGAIEGDRAEFEDVVFGLHGATDLLAWDSHVFRSNFCKHTRSLRLTASVFLICPSCPDDSTLRACADTKSVTEITVSDCPALDDLDTCGAKVPRRPLPP